MIQLPNSTITNVVAEQSSVLLPKTLTEDIIADLNSALVEEYTAHYLDRKSTRLNSSH